MTRKLADDVARRRDAALAGHRGDAATARGFLADPVPAVRATALAALARARALTAADLASGLADAAPAVRSRAAELCAARPGDAPPPLAAVLDDDDAAVVEAAAWASGERQPPEPGIVAPLAAVATGHDDPLCREAAVAALGAIGDPAGLPAILAGTADRPAVRRRAVLALAPFAGPDVDAALARAAGDRDWQVRQAAEDVAGAGHGDEAGAAPTRDDEPG
ncbi:MAG TPA: HEAT repeat domain-containing protein [Acidimicrobiales bacterium]|nr:HEAT repeat domain-containing protein [Acidimicrobiales bacterium]